MRSEKGIALLSTLGILAALLVLAAVITNSTRYESVFASLRKQSALAFNAAEAGLSVALTDPNNFLVPGTCADVAPRTVDLASQGLSVSGTVRASCDREGALPAGLKIGVRTDLIGFFFRLRSIGTYPPDAQASLEMEAGRLGFRQR